MARAKRHEQATEKVIEQDQLSGLNDPEIAAYIRALKKKFQRYAMPADEARALIDRAMGDRTLTELLYEARE